MQTTAILANENAIKTNTLHMQYQVNINLKLQINVNHFSFTLATEYLQNKSTFMQAHK